GWGKWKIEFNKICRVADWTLHDLRRTFATYFPADPWVIEAHLNHISGHISGVARTYNRRSYLLEAQMAVEKYETWLIATTG
ncbi:MAG: tyrosine-type recombinase/integrase, partial [bacterium]